MPLSAHAISFCHVKLTMDRSQTTSAALVAKKTGTESCEVESLLASACADPRKLALTIVKERQKSTLKYDAVCSKLNDEMHNRTRAELALRDIKIAKSLEDQNL